MGARPDLVAAGGSLAPVLHHFGDLLSKGSRGRSIKAGSLASLHGVVLSLERFLARAVAALEGAAAGGSSSSGAGGGAAAPAAGGGAEAQQQHQQPVVLMWRRCGWPPAGAAASQHLAAAAAEGSGGPAAAAGDGGAAAAATPAAGAEMAAAAELLGHLLDCWSEAGPSQLAETPELIGAQCLTAILRWASSPRCQSLPQSQLPAAACVSCPLAAMCYAQLLACSVLAAQQFDCWFPNIPE
jgi:hypothetical protein